MSCTTHCLVPQSPRQSRIGVISRGQTISSGDDCVLRDRAHFLSNEFDLRGACHEPRFLRATYGALISLNGVLVVLCELPLTTITRRFPARTVIAAGYLLVGIGFALNLCAHTVPALAGCMVIFTLGEMVAMPVSSSFIAGLAPAHLRGRYLGAFGLTWACGLMVGPALGMKVFALERSALWLTCGALGVLAATIIFTAGKPQVAQAGRVAQGTRALPCDNRPAG